VLISTQFAQCNNVNIGVPSLSNMHTSEPDGQNGDTYKTQTGSHKRVLSLLTEVIVLQSKRANAKSPTTVRKLWPSYSYFRKTNTFLARIICRCFTPNFIKIDQGLRNVEVQIPLALPPSQRKQIMTVAAPIFTKLAIDRQLFVNDCAEIKNSIDADSRSQRQRVGTWMSSEYKNFLLFCVKNA
jgi:hypothetical protein